jgi:ATP-binding cassette subfamily F protein uup
LSYNEQRELAALPARIEALEQEQQELRAAVAHPEFYRETPDRIRETLARLDALDLELAEVYARWDALDSRAG